MRPLILGGMSGLMHHINVIKTKGNAGLARVY